MQGTGKRVSFTEQLGRYSRYMRSLPRPFNPVVPMLGGGGLVADARLRYVAEWAGDDADECIREAVRDGLIELYRRNPSGNTRFDVYRITAKGERAHEWFEKHRDELEIHYREGEAIPFDEFIERVERGELLQVPDEWAAMDEKENARRAAAGAASQGT